MCVLAVLLLIVCGYVIYVFADYDRLEDNLTLDIVDNQPTVASASQEFTIVTWNLGFGAYSDDYSFFMDGGEQSRAVSAEAVYENLNGALSLLQTLEADFLFLQEIDADATRSYHIDQREVVLESLEGYGSVYAQNYDSPYLFYPVFEPHGASQAGMLTLSQYSAESALRRSLPIETGFMKLVDLDRCYSLTRVTLDSGKDLCLFCVHLSAYTSDGTIADEQLAMLSGQMLEEYEKGNYVVCGGDFNKDLLGDSGSIFGVSGDNFTWAQPLKEELLPDGFSVIAPLDAANPVPSCRNADIPYTPGESFVITVDGFIVSDNVTVTSGEVIDAGFAWSDHNPVMISFTLE